MTLSTLKVPSNIRLFEIKKPRLELSPFTDFDRFMNDSVFVKYPAHSNSNKGFLLLISLFKTVLSKRLNR